MQTPIRPMTNSNVQIMHPLQEISFSCHTAMLAMQNLLVLINIEIKERRKKGENMRCLEQKTRSLF